MIASLIAISLLIVVPGPVASSPCPFGTWVLNKAESDFGTAEVPRQFVVRLEETENLLSIVTLVVDVGGERVSFREYRIPSKPNGTENLLLPINSDPQRNEYWQVTAQGELVVRRVVTRRSHLIPQRLVFDRSTVVE
jgi:hypothetical protein